MPMVRDTRLLLATLPPNACKIKSDGEIIACPRYMSCRMRDNRGQCPWGPVSITIVAGTGLVLERAPYDLGGDYA